MTEIIAYTVVLEKSTRAKEAEAIKNAILMVKGVAGVTPQVADVTAYYADTKVRFELGQKLWEVLYPENV